MKPTEFAWRRLARQDWISRDRPSSVAFIDRTDDAGSISVIRASLATLAVVAATGHHCGFAAELAVQVALDLGYVVRDDDTLDQHIAHALITPDSRWGTNEGKRKDRELARPSRLVALP